MPRRSTLLTLLVLAALVLAGCGTGNGTGNGTGSGGGGPERGTAGGGAGGEDEASGDGRDGAAAASDRGSRGGALTLAFAGEVHFQQALGDLPGRPGSTLGPMSRVLRDADLAMVNLESALAAGGEPASKELEDPDARYWFRSPPAALGVLRRSGVDVVSMANNHGADYGAAGLRQSLRIADRSAVSVVGVGRGAAEAFRPHRTTIDGTDVAVLAADASTRESADGTWAASPGGGVAIASARGGRTARLEAAVRRAAAAADLVVVYVHWGEEGARCPTPDQRRLARALSRAGAGVVVGSHAHVLQGTGTVGDSDNSYVAYGLGNFLWYHGIQAETGVLRLRVRDGQVVRDNWRPARIPSGGGQPEPVTGAAGTRAVGDWRDLRACTALGAGPGADERGLRVGDDVEAGEGGEGGEGGGEGREGTDLPAYAATVRPLGPAVRRRMTGSSHDPQQCPVPLGALRLVTVTHVDADGAARRGRLVVNRDVAPDVVGVFRQLYRARFPVARMRLVDEYGADDERSMAANNSSAYNCRRVAGTDTWSDHAYGRAIDINPVQNPYVAPAGVQPPRGRAFLEADRGAGSDAAAGVIRRGGPVLRAFTRRGWTWGGSYSAPDYQHFSAPE